MKVISHVILLLYCYSYCMAAEREYNCTAKEGTQACYTCMGRDMENCEMGTVCCSGSCFKLVDEKHDLIMKGCTNEHQEDGSMKRKTLDVKLYWVHDEKVTGETFYCKGSDYCNTASSYIFASSAVLLVATYTLL
uniref:Secreted protein n=2 Tax=Parascaris univalens TaxID=6257 RepID=A0A915BHR9_PARUN